MACKERRFLGMVNFCVMSVMGCAGSSVSKGTGKNWGEGEEATEGDLDTADELWCSSSCEDEVVNKMNIKSRWVGMCVRADPLFQPWFHRR